MKRIQKYSHKKNRFTQAIMNKNRFSQIKKIKKYSHKKKKFSYANRGLNRWVDWVHVISIATFYMQGPGD